MGVSTFFVENISELQLNAMKLVTTVSIVTQSEATSVVVMDVN